MKKLLVLLGTVGFLVSLVSPLGAQIVKSGTTAGQFLKIGVGARAVAMGEAFVATANDITACYWNPGGLSRLGKNEVIFLHSEWLADISYDFAAFAIPLGEAGTFGGFVTSLTVPDDKVRTVHDPEGTGELFGATDLALGISYAKNITDRFSFGINGKFIRQKIWNMSGTAVAFDVGTLYWSQFYDLRIGMAMSNFGTKIRMEGRAGLLFVDIDPTLEGNNDKIRAHLEMEKWDLPLLFRVGFALDPIKTESQRLTIGADAIHPNDNREYVNMGFEYAFRDVLFLRGGYRGLGIYQLEGGLTAGGGVRLRLPGAVLKVDYAYVDYGRLQAVHRYAISIEF